MGKEDFIEFVELDKKRKWLYLKHYYNLASKFYKVKNNIVSDKTANEVIKNFKEKPNTLIRKRIKLDNWYFYHDLKNEGLKKEYYSFKFNDHNWEKVSIPHSYRYIPKNPIRYGKINHNFFTLKNKKYENIWYGEYSIWYRKKMEITKVKENEIVYLNYDSVNLITDVWFNEAPVMIDHWGLFPFKIDVTEEMKLIEKNEILIANKITGIVSNIPMLFYNGFQSAYSNTPYLEGRFDMDWYDQSYTGIADDVTLTITNKNHLEDVFIFTEEIKDNKAILKCKVMIKNTTWNVFNGKLILNIKKWFPDEFDIDKKIFVDVSVLPMNDNIIILNIEIKDPELWYPNDPNLYLAHIILVDENSNKIDDMFESFGIRTIKMAGSHFYLNNEKIILRGTHDSAMYYDDSMIAPSDQSIVKDILLQKKMGANCSRYPSDSKVHYKKIAEYADQLGLMLAWSGYFEMWVSHPQMELFALRDVPALVKSLRNRPSIIIWEMGDEPFMDWKHYRRYKWFEQVHKSVENEDTSRPILPAGHFAEDLVNLVSDNKNLDVDEINKKRKEILEKYPIYNKKNTYWDYHYCPLAFSPALPNFKEIDRVKMALNGEKPTVFTEFGMDGMPDWDKVIDVYGKFRWKNNPMWFSDRNINDLDYFGKLLKKDDWKEVQACQSIVLSNIIGRLRENPDKFAGYYFLGMVDVWTFCWGVVDIKFNCKLAYFVVTNSLYSNFYISGLHGNTIINKNTGLNITISNYGKEIKNTRLELIIKDKNSNVRKNKNYEGIDIKGGNLITNIDVKFELYDLNPNLYSIEYYLYNSSGEEIGKNLELFFLT